MKNILIIKLYSLLVISLFCSPDALAQMDVMQANNAFNKARSFDQENKSDSAVLYFQEAGKQFWKLYLKDHDDQYLQYFLYSKDLAGFHLNQTQQYEKTIQVIEDAIDKTDTIIDNVNEFYGNFYESKGLALKNLKKYEKAYLNYKKCLDIQKELSGSENEKLAPIYYNLGELSMNLGNYNKAVEYLEKDILLSSQTNQVNPSQLIISYNNLGVAYLNQSNFNKAKTNFKKALELSETPGTPPAVLSESFKNLGLIHETMGNYPKALEYLNKAYEVSTQDRTSVSSAGILKNIGDIQMKMGEYDQALQILKEARKILDESHFSPVLLGETDNSIGKIWEVKGDYDKAYNYYKKALELHNENRSDDPSALVITYNNIGNYFDIKGEQDKAIEYLEKAVDLQKNKGVGHTVNLAKTYGNLGKVFLNSGNYEKALEYMQRSRSIYYELYPEKNHPELSAVYNNLGNLYSRTGKYDKAIDYYEKDLNTSINFYGKDNPGTAGAYNNLANVYYSKKEFERALEFYTKSLSIYKSHYGEKHPSLIDLYNNLGNLYENKENYGQARKYHIRALKQKEKIFGKDHPSMADSYNNLGNSYFSNSKYDSAITFYTRAIDINLAVYGNNHVNVARNYGNLGNVYRGKENYPKARQYYLQSIDIFKKTLGNKHPETASTYNNLGHVYYDEEEYEKAARYYQKAIVANVESFNDTLNILRKPLLKDPLNQQILLDALLNKGDALRKYSESPGQDKKQELKDAALMHYVLSDSLIMEIRKGTHTRADKMALGMKAYRVYSSALRLCMEKVQEANSEQERNLYIKKAFSFSEKNKSRVLLQSISDAKAIQFAGIPENEVEREKDLKVKIAYYRDQLTNTEKETQKSVLRNKLFELKRNYEDLIQHFENEYPQYYQLKHSTKNVTIEEVQQMLDEKTGVLSYFVGDTTLSWFYITKQKFWANTSDKPERFADSVEHFRYGLIHKNSKRFQKHYKQLGYKYYKQFIPTNINKNISQLLIIPDGALNTIPFEALLTEKVDITNSNTAEYPFLIKRFNINYTYSATLFSEIFNRKRAVTSNSYDWLGMAPVFSTNESQGVTIYTDRSGKQNTDTSGNTAKDTWVLDGEYINPLPGTISEVKEILGLYHENRKQALVKIHSSATEQYFKSADLNEFDIIHLATHGFVNSENPDKSGILFADMEAAGEDGVLHTDEIYNLSLNTSLVNLSACETGLGKMAKGEGIIGLTRAMLYAGTQNLIVTLWQVYDLSTKNLMVDFYSNQIRQSNNRYFSKSLRNAKLKMIEESEYAHPFYWAAFILIGK